MSKARKPKKKFVGLLITAIIFLVIWGGLLAAHIVLYPDFLNFQLQRTLGTLTFNLEVDSSLAGIVWVVYIFIGATYAVLGIGLLLAIIFFIYALAKKKGPMCLLFLLILLFFVPFAQAIAGFYNYGAAYGNSGTLDFQFFSYFGLIVAGIGEMAILTIVLAGGLLLSALLAFIFGIAAFASGVKYMKQYPGRRGAADDEEEEEQPAEEAAPVAEEADEAYAEPVEEEAAPAPAPAFVPEPEPEPEEAKLDTGKLAELIRDIVRDEIARANLKQETVKNNSENQTITGATFGGPLIVQYFNGVMPQQAAAPQEKVVEVREVAKEKEPEPEPVKEEPKEEIVQEKQPEPEPEPEVVEEPVKEEPAPAPVVVPAPAPVEEKPAEEKKPIIRIPFEERMVSAEKEMQDNYNELKNEILSWGLKSRVSSSGDTFRLHRKTYVKITIAGKSLKLYFALDPADYADTKLPIQDASHKGIYEEIPMVFKVKSGLSMRRAKDLVRDVCEKDGLEQGAIDQTNWVKELKAELKEKKKNAKED